MTDNCHVARFDKEVAIELNERIDSITLYVTGMGCPNCANRVHNRLIDHPGVLKAEVDHETGKAEVTYLPTKISMSELVHLVSEADDNRHTYRVVLSRQEEHQESVNDVTPLVQARHILE